MARFTGELRARPRTSPSSRARLARLERRAAEADAVLSATSQHVHGRRADIVTVVLDSEGFPHLLNRLRFIRRVANENARILDAVRTARAEVAREKAELERRRERART